MLVNQSAKRYVKKATLYDSLEFEQPVYLLDRRDAQNTR
jgi:hypothetical protein